LANRRACVEIKAASGRNARAKVCKPSLHAELVAYERLSRAQDERALASGKISAEEPFKRNFFFEGLDFTKVRIIRTAGRKR
jgi:hypothetical protein